MTFQFHALDPAEFAGFFEMTDAELAHHDARRMVVTARPGAPCRVSLVDAEVGEAVLLVNYEHQPAASPYRSRHAIFVRAGAAQAHPAIGTVPDALKRRLISLRQFDGSGMMVGADVVPGDVLGAAIEKALVSMDVDYLHLHFAKPGCYAATVRRA